MANVYLSFLGTNDYIECYYVAGDFKTPEPVRFVQEATILQNCAKWGAEDRIFIFTTDDAEKINWKDDGHCDFKTKEVKRCEGVETRLKKLALKTPFKKIPIKPGYDQDEIWHQFDAVFDLLNPGDNVIFDVTHAFRSIPMLALVVIQYAKIFKSVTLKGIYYGAFEALGSVQTVRDMPVEQRNAPLVDLTPLAQLMDWTVATDRFLKSGDTALMGELAKSSVANILKDSTGKNANAQKIENMQKPFEQMSLMLSTCRGRDISQVAENLKQAVVACRDMELLLPPFKRLFGHIEQRIEAFSGNYLVDGFAAVRWCCEHNLIQRGFTILEELLISFVVKETGGDESNKDLRDIASQSFKIIELKKQEKPEEWKKPAGEKENRDITKRMIVFILSKGDIYKNYAGIRDLRNDLNHAGHVEGAKPVAEAGSFAKKLKELCEAAESILAPDIR